MAEIAVILSGLATSNEGAGYDLLFTASPLGLNCRQIRISNIWHVQRRKSCQLLGWMENSPYYSATTGIRTSDLLHSITTSKKILRCYPPGHNCDKVAHFMAMSSYTKDDSRSPIDELTVDKLCPTYLEQTKD